MYGDCQVMSSIGGNVVSSETLFSSQIQNPNFNFMPTMPSFQPFSITPKEENGLFMRGKDEILESGSGSEQLEEKSGNEQENSGDQNQPLLLSNGQPSKKKRYHRHTHRQISEMESLFKDCPHPDDKQRMKLSHDLGLKPRQVKFWFQNRRTQMKAQQDRSDNLMLRAENDNLKNENYRLQSALRNVMCPNCGGAAMIGDIGIDEQQLRIENARLREELDRVCCLTSRYSGRSMPPMGSHIPALMPPQLELEMGIYPRNNNNNNNFQDHSMSEHMVPVPMLPQFPAEPNNGLLLLDEEKPLAMELSVSCMSELIKMCHSGPPLWVPSRADQSGAIKEVLNLEEHARTFQWSAMSKGDPDADFRTEATRDSAVVIMNSITLVDAFLDSNKWMELFPSIVSRAKTLQIISSDPSGHASGSLQMMFAELQYLSPLVPTRESHFLRYCHQNPKEGIWVIVDFPIDSFRDTSVLHQPSLPRYKRRPSGCVIQDMPNGYSRVTWVEQAEIEEKPIHPTFSGFVQSGTAFGAHRWLSVLQSQCERVASLMARNISDLGVIPSPEARRNIIKLSQRMIRTFCANISTSGGQSWTALSDPSPDDTVRITQRTITEPGQPNGVVLGAVSTTWLPFPHYHVFDLLRDERRRSQLEVLSNGNALQELSHIANGSHPGNCISLLRINVASNSSQNVELMLQESCTDQSGSMVVYSTMRVDDVQLAMSGQDPSCIPILPMGFVIVPVDPTNASAASSSSDHPKPSPGCLLTVGLQVLVSTMPTAKVHLNSISAINTHLATTVQQIAAALGSPVGPASNDNVNGASTSLEECLK